MARKPALPGVDRRQQILEAALEVFAEQGFDGATTKDIAKRADVTHGLIYFYFDSKEDLFLAAFEHEAKSVFTQLDFTDVIESDAPPTVTLTLILRRFLRAIASTPAQSILRVMMHMAAHEERAKGPLRECRSSMEAHIRTLSDQVRQYLDRQVEKGRIRSVNTRLVAILLLGSAMTLYRSKRYGAGETLEVTAESATSNIYPLQGSYSDDTELMWEIPAHHNASDAARQLLCDGIAAAIADTFLHGIALDPAKERGDESADESAARNTKRPKIPRAQTRKAVSVGVTHAAQSLSEG